MLIKAIYEAAKGKISSFPVGKSELKVDEDVRETCTIFAKIHTVLMVGSMMLSFYLAESYGTYSLNNCFALSLILMAFVTLVYSLLVKAALNKRYRKEGRLK